MRNIESALLAHLGMRVDHRKISVATTVDAPRIRLTPPGAESAVSQAAPSPEVAVPPSVAPLADLRPVSVSGGSSAAPQAPSVTPLSRAASAPARMVSREAESAVATRRYVFDDVEVKRSRSGLNCRVTLRRGDESF